MADKTKQKGADLTGLDDFSLSSFIGGGKKSEAPEGADQTAAGAISYAPLDHFHEDEDNARQEFNKDRLQELANSMQQVNTKTGEARGILEPLSVKHHPDEPGHFIINGGARRYRAAKLAGLEQAPYVIKDELDDFDKFVLNDQREQLSPMEVAMFITARLDEGHKPGEVAKALGRRPAYVSDHSIFFEMADCIRDLYDNGRCRSMQVLAWLHRAYKKHPEEVEAFCLDADKELTSSQVRAFLDSLKKPEAPEGGDENPSDAKGEDEDQEPATVDGDAQGEPDQTFTPQGGEGASNDEEPGEEFPDPSGRDEDQQPLILDGEPLSGGTLDDQADHVLGEDEHADRIKKAIVQVKHDEREARLLTDRRAAYGLAWIKYDDDGREVEVDLNQVALVAVIEA